MRIKGLLFIYLLISSAASFAKEQLVTDQLPVNVYSAAFQNAYATYPNIPKGVLEAVAYTQTHFTHVTHTSTEPLSCSGRPNIYGVMGLIIDGQGLFRNNLQTISQLSGISEHEIQASPEKSIMAYAAAYNKVLTTNRTKVKAAFSEHINALLALSELPLSNDLQNDYVLNTHLYGIISFLTNKECQSYYGFNDLGIDPIKLFGSDNYAVLSSGRVSLTHNEVETQSGQNYRQSGLNNLNSPLTADYPPALWKDAIACAHGSRNGTSISALAIHTTVGSYAGSISWFVQCNPYKSSAHYVIRSNDGQITQMVLESDRANHIRSSNSSTIGIEHEAFIAQASYYTTTMLTSSANLVKDICNSGYGINPLRTYYGSACSGLCEQDACIKIKGHQMFPAQTHGDPGPNWNWVLYYKLINDNPTITTLTASSGNIYDAGGPNASYNDDERKLTLIAPTGASKVTLSFSQFDFESAADWLFIYDGATLTSPLIGKYTGTSSPGTLTATSGKVLIEYRTDCSVNNAGFAATWTADSIVVVNPGDVIPPTTQVDSVPVWISNNFSASFDDNDNLGDPNLDKLFYQVSDYNGTEWRANTTRGFFNDNFDGSTVNSDWKQKIGTWSLNNNELSQTDEASGNTNIYAPLNQNLSNAYLYAWAGKITGSGTSRRAGFHFMCDAPDSVNRGNSYFIWFRLDDKAIQLYKTSYSASGNVFGLPLKDTAFNFANNQWYNFKVIYDRITGITRLYINDKLAFTYDDPSPLTTGNYISFRSGNATYAINNLRAYRSRTATESILVGSGNTNDIRYENTNPTAPAGKIRSIATDKSANISASYEQDVNVDWTAPSVAVVIDGLVSDADTTSNKTQLNIAWSGAVDPSSGISKYKYAIGTSPGTANISPWKDTMNVVEVTVSNLNLTKNVTYFASVKAINGVNMESAVGISDGIKVVTPEAIGEINKNISKVTLFPNPVQTNFTMNLSLVKNELFDINLTDVTGRIVKAIAQKQLYRSGSNTITVDELNLPAGMYFINLYSIDNHVMSTYKIAVK